MSNIELLFLNYHSYPNVIILVI